MTPERWQQIEKIYHAVLECEQDGRDAFLDEACTGDEGLRQEVESLLDLEALWKNPPRKWLRIHPSPP